MIALAEVVDTPILIVHVSTVEGVQAIREARARGVKVYGETCPQYLFLTAEDIDRGLEGAMFCCSPPPRDAAAQQACWDGLKDGTLAVYSSDHAPYRYRRHGQAAQGREDHVQGNGQWRAGAGAAAAAALHLRRGRRAHHARTSSCSSPPRATPRSTAWLPAKGTIAPGSDADIAIWDPEHRVTVDAALLHDNTGYTPYAGRELKGWPVTVLSRGEVLVDAARPGEITAARGRGRFIARQRTDALQPAGRQIPEMAQLAAWNTPLAL